jgi:ABC-type Fe3+/spermidine/putrescine transport system ATPase subunit
MKTEQTPVPSDSQEVTCDVELRGVSKLLGGRRVVDNITIEVRRGEFYSLLGPSGCGKTTLLRMIAGFEVPDAGEVRLGGVNMSGVPVHRRNLNLVFQNYALFPHMNVGRNIAFGLRMQNVRDPGPLVTAALEKVRLPGYESRAPSTLSGGEQQRVALARAIVTNPRVLLLDEPLGALDLKLRKGLQEELRRLQRELAMTFIYVTHDQEEALSMSHRIAVMNKGIIEQVGTPRDIYDRPASRFVAGFVGAVNFIEDNGKTLVVRPEKISLSSNAPNGKDGMDGIEAVVEEIFFYGATTRVIVRAGEQRIVIDDGSARVNVGDRVRVYWKPEHAQALAR